VTKLGGAATESRLDRFQRSSSFRSRGRLPRRSNGPGEPRPRGAGKAAHPLSSGRRRRKAPSFVPSSSHSRVSAGPGFPGKAHARPGSATAIDSGICIACVVPATGRPWRPTGQTASPANTLPGVAGNELRGGRSIRCQGPKRSSSACRSAVASTSDAGRQRILGAFAGLLRARRKAPPRRLDRRRRDKADAAARQRGALRWGGMDAARTASTTFSTCGASRSSSSTTSPPARSSSSLVIELVEGAAEVCRANSCVLLGGRDGRAFPAVYAEGRVRLRGHLRRPGRARAA